MSEKTLRMALYSLAALVVLYGAVYLMRGSGSGPASSDSELADAFAALAADSRTRFDIEGPRGDLALERGADGWTVNGFEADSGAVERFLRALGEVEVAGVAAANPANHARLGVDADSAWALSAQDGPTVLLGKAGNRFRTAYARMPGADAASLIEGDLRSAAARPLLDWRNKLILALDTAAVASIRVARDGQEALYERGEAAWTMDGGEADEVSVRNMLQELASLRASGFAEDGADMSENVRTVVAADAAGVELAAITLADGDGNIRLATGASPYVFEVPTFRAGRIAPEPPEEE